MNCCTHTQVPKTQLTPKFSLLLSLSYLTGGTVLGTPAVTSFGLFHQQSTNATAASSRNAPNKATARRDSGSSLRRPRGAAGDHAETASAGSAPNDGSSNQESNDLLERHTSAAKDGVIDMLTDKASKLGVSLERALLAKKDAEDGAARLQVHCWRQ